MPLKTSPKIVLSGGGTGGHIFPAIAIADELKKRFPEAEFLFVGAKDKMEMQKVPQAGYKIKGLWISGISRSNMLANVKFPFKVFSSIFESYKTFKQFKPDIAIGTGGFASGPALWTAGFMKKPIFVQEQNSFPGITNKFLKGKAQKIFVAYEGMEKFFPKEKLINAGNPVRKALFENQKTQSQAKKELGLDENKLTILSVGGSLGSKTLNDAWLSHLAILKKENVQLLWQTGSLEFPIISKKEEVFSDNIKITEFIQDMSTAYKAADIIVSRAGAIAISELCLAGKPVLLVPFPFAAEDHQTQNALNLVERNAAIMVKDKEVSDKFGSSVTSLIQEENLRKSLSENILKLAKPNATQQIVDEIEKYLVKK